MRITIVCALVAAAAAPALAKTDDPKAAVTKLVDREVHELQPMIGEDELPEDLYLDGASFSVRDVDYDQGEVGAAQLADYVLGPCANLKAKRKDVRVQLAADGQTAVVSFGAWFQIKCDVSGDLPELERRASEIIVKTPQGWRVAGGLWSADVPNAAVNKAAIAGTLSKLAAVAPDDGDAGVKAAVDALLAKGVDDAAAARKELIAIGSGPKEVTTGGAAFAKPWKAAWVGHARLDGKVLAKVAPSGTTAWAIANVILTKTKGGKTYEIPFRVLFAFDKAGGAWSLMHAHFAASTL